MPAANHPGATGAAPAARLIHLSDPHLSVPSRPAGAARRGKQVLGYWSWHRRRRHVHQRPLLDALAADVRRQCADQVVVTGDLTQIGQADEFRQAAHWLQALGPPQQVTIIPGNHDAYVPGCLERGMQLLRGYLPDGGAAPAWPRLRRVGPLLLIGLSSAVPASALTATGTLGGPQLQALDRALATAADQGLCRVLLVHHPVAPGQVRWRKRLTDAAALARLLRVRGAELVLHGHAHRQQRYTVQGPHGPVPVLGAASASALDARHGRAASYHLIEIYGEPGDWQCMLSVRASDGGERFSTVQAPQALPGAGAHPTGAAALS